MNDNGYTFNDPREMVEWGESKDNTNNATRCDNTHDKRSKRKEEYPDDATKVEIKVAL